MDPAYFQCHSILPEWIRLYYLMASGLALLCFQRAILYKGDTMLQKTFTKDLMTGKKSKNIGQRNKYYVKGSHLAIVPTEVFDKVQ